MATNNAINQKLPGIVTYNGAGVYFGRSIVPPVEGIGISNANGVSGNPTLALTDDLLALESLTGTGFSVRTANDTWALRTLQAGTGVSITNGDGVAGNPVINASVSVPTTFTEDSGTATPALNNINIFGTALQGISTSGSGATVTITASDATDTQKGVASFNVTNFTVASGNVTSNAITFTAGTGLTGGGSGNLGGNISYALTVPVVVSSGGTGRTTLTTNAVLYGLGTSPVGLTNTATDGQVLIGATGAAPAFATISGSAGITVTPGANTLALSNVNIPNSALQNSSITLTAGTGISISVSPVSLGGSTTISASATTPTQFTADSGTAAPAANNLNILGNSTAGIITSATGSTVTVTASASSTTQRGTVSLATNAEAIAGTDTAKAVTSDDLKAKLGVQTLNGIAYGQGTTAALAWTSALTNGQLIIGSTGAAPQIGSLTQPAAGITITGGAGSITFALANDLAAVEALSTTGLATRTATDTWTTRTITAGTGISVSNGDGVAGNPVITATGGGGGLTWSDQSGSFGASVSNGYFITAASTPTLPAAPSQGDQIAFICDTGSTVTVTANTGQRIRLGSTQTASAGTAVSATIGNAIDLIYRSSDATWIALNSVGIWALT